MSRFGLDFQYSFSRKQSKFPSIASLVRQKQIPSPKSFPPSCSTKVYQTNAEEIKRVFEKLDTNKDGRISLEEYKAASRTLLGKVSNDLELIKAFKMADSDGDGSIDIKEFMEMQNVGGGIKAIDIEGAFHLYDLDGDGKISPEELWDLMKRLGEKSSLDSCRRMVREVDADGDGSVNLDEFMNMMTRSLKPSC